MITLSEGTDNRRIEFITPSRLLRIREGDNVLEATLDGKQPVQLRRGPRVIVTLRELPKEEKSTDRDLQRPSKVPPASQPIEFEDVHRRAAELALRSQGSVNLQVKGHRFRKWVQNTRQIPEERFKVFSLRFGSEAKL